MKLVTRLSDEIKQFFFGIHPIFFKVHKLEIMATEIGQAKDEDKHKVRSHCSNVSFLPKN